MQNAARGGRDVHFINVDDEMPHDVRIWRTFQDFVNKTTVEGMQGLQAEADNPPLTHRQAAKSPFHAQWAAAESSEVQNLVDMGVIDVLKRRMMPAGMKLVNSKFVYKVKLKDGALDKFKARLVAVGSSQVKGVHYFENFSPTSTITSLRTLIAHAARHGGSLHGYDIKAAYLTADIDVDSLYVRPPAGLPTTDADGDDIIWHMRKALYGTKQAGRCWYLKLHGMLMDAGFEQSTFEPCMYTLKQDGVVTWALIAYVDDVAMWKHPACRGDPLELIRAAVEVTGDGNLTWMLGMAIDRDDTAGRTTMHQHAYITDMLRRFNADNVLVAKAPRQPTYKVNPKKGDATDYVKTEQPFLELVGSLMYLCQCTRPDIAEALGKVCQAMACPTDEDWAAAMQILRYVKATREHMLTFTHGIDEDPLVWYDASLATEYEWRATCGVIASYSGALITWSSRVQQATIASSAEAEYVSGCCASELTVHLLKFLADMGSCTTSMRILGDNKSAISMGKSLNFSRRTRHIPQRYYALKQRVNAGTCVMQYVPTHLNLADGFTKALVGKYLRGMVGQMLGHDAIKYDSLVEVGTVTFEEATWEPILCPMPVDELLYTNQDLEIECYFSGIMNLTPNAIYCQCGCDQPRL